MLNSNLDQSKNLSFGKELRNKTLGVVAWAGVNVVKKLVSDFLEKI